MYVCTYSYIYIYKKYCDCYDHMQYVNLRAKLVELKIAATAPLHVRNQHIQRPGY